MKEIIAKLKEKDEYSKLFEELIFEKDAEETINGVKIKIIVSERENSSYIVVFQIDDYKYFRAIGSYASQEGVDFWGQEWNWTEVKPKKKTITVWE